MLLENVNIWVDSWPAELGVVSLVTRQGDHVTQDHTDVSGIH